MTISTLLDRVLIVWYIEIINGSCINRGWSRYPWRLRDVRVFCSVAGFSSPEDHASIVQLHDANGGPNIQLFLTMEKARKGGVYNEKLASFGPVQGNENMGTI